MRNINIFDTDMFPYLEGEEIKNTAITLTIKDIKSEKMKSHKGREEVKEVLYFRETKKGFVLNKTNAKRIAQMYGAQTAQWEGRQITLTTEPVQAFGELHNALRVVPGVISSQPTNGEMTLEKLLVQLNRLPNIRGYYKAPQDILACRADGAELPPADDIEGWRVLFVDARDYALEEIHRAIEEGDILPTEPDEEVAAELTQEFPEIFDTDDDQPF